MTRARGGDERGSVAITVALSLTVLLGFAALVVDVGLNWAARTEAQTAADSAALAGAAQLPDGPAAAITTVRDYLNANASGLADGPADPNWPANGSESDGEIVCWTLPAGAPGPGAGCPDGSNALQVITPPIDVRYAFAGVFGAGSNRVKALAAAGTGPGAPNNCVLCLLEPVLPDALLVNSVGGVDVTGGGITVNSSAGRAASLAGVGDITADQINVVGGIQDAPGGGQFSPAPATGGPPAIDPLVDLPTPDGLASPPSCCFPAQNVTADGTLTPGVYASITVASNATLTLEEGVYVLTESPGLAVSGNGRVASTGDGVTIYLACTAYPSPCSGPGATVSVTANGRYQATSPTGGEYAGLSIFYDRGNTAPMVVSGTAGLNPGGAVYAASAPVLVSSTGRLRLDSLLVADSLVVSGSGPVALDFDPGVPLPAVGRPVLIR
jgi:hypothetical protein